MCVGFDRTEVAVRNWWSSRFTLIKVCRRDGVQRHARTHDAHRARVHILCPGMESLTVALHALHALHALRALHALHSLRALHCA